MHNLIIGQGGDVDWIELIIIIVLFGGGILSAVAKKLIAMFTPEEKQAPPKMPDLKDTIHHPVPRSPIARGTPASGQTTPRTQARRPAPPPPTARPLPRIPTIVAIDEDEVEEPLIPRPRPKVRPAPTSSPSAQPKPTPRRKTGSPAQAEKRLGHLDVEVLKEEAEFEAETAKRMAHLQSSVSEAEEVCDSAVDDRLGDAESADEPVTDPMATLLGGDISPQTLRRAILLREILGPPVALLPPDDRF